MKAELLLATLSLVAAVAQAKYDLSCAESELSIRWPSYDSNSEYYVCSRLFGRQMTITCNPGEVFTFALQSCTAPNRYIPAPAFEILPTASPLLSKPNEDGYLTPIEIPDHPPVQGILNYPSVIGPPTIDVAISQSQVTPPTIHLPAVAAFEEPKQEETEADQKEENNAVAEEPADNMVPLPPTPPPTPPVVEKHHNKKPSSVSNKKPSSSKKKKSTTSSSAVVENKPNKKPSKAAGKKPAAKKNAKQSTQSHKTPKKSAKKPKKTTDKKSQKA